MSAPSPYATLVAGTPVREATAAVLGGDTHYWDYGPADAPLTIVAVHGFRGDHHGLEALVVQFSGIRIISPDLPGFGDTAPIAGRVHDIDLYAEWLEAFVTALALPTNPIVLGHSFGSIVVSAAIARGLDPASVILINPIAAPALQGPKAALTQLAVFYYWMGAKLPKGVGGALMGSPVVTRGISVGMATTKDKALRRWIHDQHHTYFNRFFDRDTLLDGFRASTGNNVIQFASKITQPTLLIAAANDPITKVSDEEKLRDLLPNATLHVLPDVGHLIHYERPREAAQLIVEFLGVGSLAAEIAAS